MDVKLIMEDERVRWFMQENSMYVDETVLCEVEDQTVGWIYMGHPGMGNVGDMEKWMRKSCVNTIRVFTQSF